MKALLKQVKGFGHFTVGSHYRILSGELSTIFQKDNLVGSVKGKFRRDQSWREAGEQVSVVKIIEVRNYGSLNQSGRGRDGVGEGIWKMVSS